MDSDEDSGEEDGGGNVDNLGPRQLQAGAEVILASKNRLGSEPEINFSPDDKPEEQEKSQILKTVIRDWKKDDLRSVSSVFPESDYSKYRNLSPVQCFELFWNDEVIEFLLTESTKYALFKNCSDPKITYEEIKGFLGILILSGYNPLPSRRYYWDSGLDMRNEMVHSTMRRDRFETIMRFIHSCDNTKIDANDRMWKLRPLINMLRKKFALHFQPEQDLSYDESMIKYFGRHGCKQFLKGKPIRFGYKAWCLNTTMGYLVDFQIYQGADPQRNEKYEKAFGKCAAPLIQMIDSLSEKNKHLPYRFYFDNLFTSQTLLIYLKQRGFGATGTIRENRLPKECHLIPSNTMSKRNKRGDFDYKSSKESGIIVARWLDNSTVTIASTSHGISPVSTVARYCRQEKKRILVPRPNVIGEYNKNMGGTDRMDENVALYRVSVRGKKWWWPIFTWLLDISIHNGWLLHRKTGINMPQLHFRRYIVKCYLTSNAAVPRGPGRPAGNSNQGRVLHDIRYDETNHLVAMVPQKKRRRCAAENCKGTPRTMCCKCDVGLCIECFVPYHRK